MKHTPDYQSETFNEFNKRYYRDVEDYDWVRATDHLIGLESFFHRARVKFTLSLIRKFGMGARYLDAGCGTGLMLRMLPAGSYGIDLNPRHLKRAAMYVPNAKLVLGDIESLPFENDFFSTVVCTEVLEHQPNSTKGLAELVRVLEKGGRLIGTTPRRKWIWRFRWLSSTRPREPYHKEYTQKEIKMLFAPYRVLFLKKGNFGMNWGFVLEK